MRRLVLLAAAASIAAPPCASAQSRMPNLSGTWALRDSLQAPAPVARDSAIPPDSALPPDSTEPDSVEAPPDSAAARGNPRGPGRMGPNQRDTRQIQRLLGMATPVRAFTIAQTDSSITITNEGGFSYSVPLDKRKVILPLDDSVSVEAQAKWDDGALVIEYRPTGGGKLTETYFLADSHRYLRLEVAVEHKAMFRRYWQSRMYRRLES
jgi:hypothetical protein